MASDIFVDWVLFVIIKFPVTITSDDSSLMDHWFLDRSVHPVKFTIESIAFIM